MRSIYALNEVDEQHLVEVMEVAKQVGSVTINVYDNGDSYTALNGSHRLEAALRLQLPVILERMSEDDVLTHDIDGLSEHLYHELYLDEPKNTATVLQIIEFISSSGKVYSDEEAFVSVTIV